MSIRVHLNKPHAFYTNLDVVTGTVILNLPRDEAIAAIVVKLEGESRTRLAGVVPNRRPVGGSLSARLIGREPYDDAETELEVHKILYKVAVVFPGPNLAQAGATYTIPAGQHVYPFQFKIPFNNSCSTLDMQQARLFDVGAAQRHTKNTLPPTLTGFPGEAEILYYVKVTVQRPAFYKENYRSIVHFNFFPIEPIRQSPNGRESYARRTYQFAPHIAAPPKLTGKPSSAAASSADAGPLPNISIDGRLPDPAIITCNDILPLRIVVKRLNDTPHDVYLALIQIELVGFTNVRAQHLERRERRGWMLVSKSNVNVRLTSAETGKDREWEVDRKLWSQIPLPNTVQPTFETCNISRFYHLEITVGFSYGLADGSKSNPTTQTLHMPVQVFSGLAPPAALQAEMARRQERFSSSSSTTHPFLSPTSASRPAATAPRPSSSQQRPPSFAPSYSSSSSQPPSPIPLHTPTQPGYAGGGGGPPGFGPGGAAAEGDELPPPSYEDAIAEDMAPVDGPRRDYHQQEVRESTVGGGGDGKRNRGSRLFP